MHYRYIFRFRYIIGRLRISIFIRFLTSVVKRNRLNKYRNLFWFHFFFFYTKISPRTARLFYSRASARRKRSPYNSCIILRAQSANYWQTRGPLRRRGLWDRVYTIIIYITIPYTGYAAHYNIDIIRGERGGVLPDFKVKSTKTRGRKKKRFTYYNNIYVVPTQLDDEYYYYYSFQLSRKYTRFSEQIICTIRLNYLLFYLFWTQTLYYKL